jgi:hypothetical protein
MDVDVSANPVTMNSVVVAAATGRSGNMTMEFDLNTNLLHFYSIAFNAQTRKSKLYFGILNPVNGAVSYEDSIGGYSGVVMSSGTFDQTGQNFCIEVLDSNNRYKMVGYQVLGSYWFETALPAGNVYEIEANNFAYVQAKYALTASKEMDPSVLIYPNPVQDVLQVIGVQIGSNYRIINQQGQTVLSGKTVQFEEKIDVSNLNPGFYVVLFDKINTRQKVVVQR